MELRRRRDGEVQRDPSADRPFAGISDENLRKYAQHPVPRQQREAANRELLLRATGASRTAPENRAFGKAPMREVTFYAYATDDEIRERNKRNLK